MSLSANAYAVIGIQIPTNELFVSKKYRIGNHSFPESQNFDATTGKKLWDARRVCVLNNGEELWGEVAKVGNISIKGVNEGMDTEHYYLGTVVEVSDLCAHGGGALMPVSLDKVPDIKQALVSLLTPHGLWDESKFGVWAVGYSSY